MPKIFMSIVSLLLALGGILVTHAVAASNVYIPLIQNNNNMGNGRIIFCRSWVDGEDIYVRRRCAYKFKPIQESRMIVSVSQILTLILLKITRHKMRCLYQSIQSLIWVFLLSP